MVAAALAAVCATPAAAIDEPLASLVPADAQFYVEVSLDRMLGKAPETAALAEVFSNMKSPELIRQAVGQADEEAGQIYDEVITALGDASNALGPRIAVAVWMPDMGAMLGGAMMGAAGAEKQAAMAMAPKVLVVADIRDEAGFDALAAYLIERLEAPAPAESSHGGAKVMSFAEGMVELIRGDGWAAAGFPAERARTAADRAAGEVTGGSLWEDAQYQQVMGRLPDDAILTEYVSAASIQQSLAMAQMAAPQAGISYPAGESLGVALGVRVEEVQGRRMVTTYYTTDLDTAVAVTDASLGMQAALLVPILSQAREGAQKAVCLSNMKQVSLAMQMYLADNEDGFPPADQWVAALSDYRKNEEVLKCPDDESDAACSYAMNAALDGKSMTSIRDPVSVVVFFETANPGDNPVGDVSDVVSDGRHDGGANYGFADGHASWHGEPPSFGGE
jgi:prepilin-type processing-associated H-X9-DG protein